jgi:hypothetical protein
MTTWHPQLDNPNFLGWLVVVFYLVAAFACGWIALKSGKVVSEGSSLWWVLAVVLLFLGINKQLNLQTLLIVMGRRAALAGGWYRHRRFAQGVFCVVLALLGLGFLAFFISSAKRFIERNRLAFTGVVVLLIFVILRALTINHANELVGVDLKDSHWAWILELSGSTLIALSAAAAIKSSNRGDTLN